MKGAPEVENACDGAKGEQIKLRRLRALAKYRQQFVVMNCCLYDGAFFRVSLNNVLLDYD